MNPRYQVFVSSTFRDLQEERQAVLDAILEMNNFPAGMEIFPAANATPWELIRSIIKESDYYILIIGGKYGSTDEDGISYTEREFDLATELGNPILPFLHGNPDDIPSGKSEMSPEARDKLTRFREKVEGHRHCKYWNSKEQLQAQVVVALNAALRTDPVPGWVKADGVNNPELLARIADLHQRLDMAHEEIATLRRTVGDEGIEIENLAGEDAEVEVPFMWRSQSTYLTPLTWGQIFYGIAERMLSPATERQIERAMFWPVFRSIHGTPLWKEVTRDTIEEEIGDLYFELADRFAVTIAIQLMALGLVMPTHVSSPEGPNRAWVLTDKGRRKFLESRALRTDSDSDENNVDET